VAAKVGARPVGAQVRFFELRGGDRLNLHRFVAGMLDADIDRGDQLRVTFVATLPGSAVMSPAEFLAAEDAERSKRSR
jgi:hypothetical protein